MDYESSGLEVIQELVALEGHLVMAIAGRLVVDWSGRRDDYYYVRHVTYNNGERGVRVE